MPFGAMPSAGLPPDGRPGTPWPEMTQPEPSWPADPGGQAGWDRGPGPDGAADWDGRAGWDSGPDYGRPDYGGPDYADGPGYGGAAQDAAGLGMLEFSNATDRTTQLYPPENSGYPGWPSQPGERDAGPGGPGGQPTAARGSKRTRLIALAAVIVVLAAGVTVLLTRNSGGSPPAGTGSASSTAPSIDNVATDPAPLTVSEVFPSTTVTAGGYTLSPVAQSVESSCSQAAQGAFAAALTTGKCEQVLRVTFVSHNKHWAVTAGIASLPTLAAAHQAAGTEDFGSDSWFTGLNGPADSGAGHVTTTPGYAYQTLLGRYIIFALAAPGHGKTSTRDSATLTTLSQDLTSLAAKAIVAREK
jgi:hypothetical protein